MSLIMLMLLVLSAPTPRARAAAEGPVISDLQAAPAAGAAGSLYTLRLRMTHPVGADYIVPRLYQVREGIEPIELALNDDGQAGDLKKGDGIYSGQSRVPDTAARQAHRFEVFVRDKAGRKSNVMVYRFMVIEGVNIRNEGLDIDHM